MGLLGILAFFGSMLLLAALPSTSVLFVVSRAVAGGFRQGAAAAAGIVLGDLVFVLAALGGLAASAQAMGEYFAVIKVAGGLYLIGFGVTLLRHQAPSVTQLKPGMTLAGSFLAGLLLTLGDLKAVFFYASLFPVFVDVSHLGPGEALSIVLITLLAVGGVKLAYAYWASVARKIVKNPQRASVLRKGAGGMCVGAGVVLIAKV